MKSFCFLLFFLNSIVSTDIYKRQYAYNKNHLIPSLEFVYCLWKQITIQREMRRKKRCRRHQQEMPTKAKEPPGTRPNVGTWTCFSSSYKKKTSLWPSIGKEKNKKMTDIYTDKSRRCRHKLIKDARRINASKYIQLKENNGNLSSFPIFPRLLY